MNATATKTQPGEVSEAVFNSMPPVNGPMTTIPEQRQSNASHANLATALAKAIEESHAVEHDSNNTYHNYRYTSAEALFAECRRVLSRNGLSVVTVARSVDGYEREGQNRFELVQLRRIFHASGESIDCASRWPICPDKGRPLDKATAAAATLDYAYFLRDLLQLPRSDGETVDQRDDRNYQPEPAKRRDQPQEEPPQEQDSEAEFASRKVDWLNRMAASDGIDKFNVIAKEIDAIPVGRLRAELKDSVKEFAKSKGYWWAKDVKAFQAPTAAPAKVNGTPPQFDASLWVGKIKEIHDNSNAYFVDMNALVKEIVAIPNPEYARSVWEHAHKDMMMFASDFNLNIKWDKGSKQWVQVEMEGAA